MPIEVGKDVEMALGRGTIHGGRRTSLATVLVEVGDNAQVAIGRSRVHRPFGASLAASLVQESHNGNVSVKGCPVHGTLCASFAPVSIEKFDNVQVAMLGCVVHGGRRRHWAVLLRAIVLFVQKTHNVHVPIGGRSIQRCTIAMGVDFGVVYEVARIEPGHGIEVPSSGSRNKVRPTQSNIMIGQRLKCVCIASRCKAWSALPHPRAQSTCIVRVFIVRRRAKTRMGRDARAKIDIIVQGIENDA